MKHLFVLVNLAILAKNKGFNEKCLAHYDLSNRFVLETLEFKGSGEIDAPLYQQLIDWFREKHSIHIRIDQVSKEEEYSPFIFLERSSMDWTSVWKGDYYQALDKALEEVFKLI